MLPHDTGSCPYLVKSRAREPPQGKWRNLPSGTTLFSVPSCDQANLARPPTHLFSPKLDKNHDTSTSVDTIRGHTKRVYSRGGYCLSNDFQICFPIIFVVTRAIGGKHGRLSKMYASARGQGWQGPRPTALALSRLWLSVYARHTTWETRMAEVASRVPLLSRPLHESFGEDVRRLCELRAEMDPALRRRPRGKARPQWEGNRPRS